MNNLYCITTLSLSIIREFITPELFTAIVTGLITGGLTFFGVVITKKKEKEIADGENELELQKNTNSSAIDMIEIYHTEVKELRETMSNLTKKNEELINSMTEQKIEISKLLRKNEELALKNEELLNKNEELQKKNEELSLTNHELMKQNEVLLAKLEKFDK